MTTATTFYDDRLYVGGSSEGESHLSDFLGVHPDLYEPREYEVEPAVHMYVMQEVNLPDANALEYLQKVLAADC